CSMLIKMVMLFRNASEEHYSATILRKAISGKVGRDVPSRRNVTDKESRSRTGWADGCASAAGGAMGHRALPKSSFSGCLLSAGQRLGDDLGLLFFVGAG